MPACVGQPGRVRGTKAVVPVFGVVQHQVSLSVFAHLWCWVVFAVDGVVVGGIVCSRRCCFFVLFCGDGYGDGGVC